MVTGRDRSKTNDMEHTSVGRTLVFATLDFALSRTAFCSSISSGVTCGLIIVSASSSTARSRLSRRTSCCRQQQQKETKKRKYGECIKQRGAQHPLPRYMDQSGETKKTGGNGATAIQKDCGGDRETFHLHLHPPTLEGRLETTLNLQGHHARQPAYAC